MIKAVDFAVIHLIDQKSNQNVILLYTLGEDGILREYTNGKWISFPIEEPKEEL